MQIPTVGRELALQVAQNLVKGKSLVYLHPYYCGIGLLYREGAYMCLQVGDWPYPSLDEALILQAQGKDECKVFPDTDSFIEWLSVQSDESLDGHELDDPWLRANQRLTIERLRQFVQAEDVA